MDTRRQLIVQEVNAIGTAYLRLDLLPKNAQTPLREDFRKYVSSRAALFPKISDASAAFDELNKTLELQKQIWTQAVNASSGPEYQSARMLLLPALNDMIDIVTTRSVAIQTHPPLPIFLMLAMIALACTGVTGYRASITEKSPHFYSMAFAAVIVFTFYLILDIEYPRFGLIRLDHANHLLIELVETMK